jgi:hypothetical protein
VLLLMIRGNASIFLSIASGKSSHPGTYAGDHNVRDRWHIELNDEINYLPMPWQSRRSLLC